MARSPASSPRLPSPPPMAEDQIGPTSPGAIGDEDPNDKLDQEALYQAASRRIRPGTKAEDMHEGPPLVNFADIDSAFQLTEHLKALFTHFTTSPTTSVPITRQTAIELSTPPPGVDRGIWLYELCRLLVSRANTILVSLFADAPACSATTCPEMRASEWQYLCAAHDPPKSCCAIDYCCHTLDWCATQLTSSKLFPSRLALGTETITSQQQLRKMTEIFRRVYRIFAHAWFQHRAVFWRVEGRTGLYVFFKTVCDEFRLIPEDSYTVPPEAEGGMAADDEEEEEEAQAEREQIQILAREEQSSGKETQKRQPRAQIERQNSVSTIIHEEVEEEESDEESEHEPARGAVVEVPSYEAATQLEPPAYAVAETQVIISEESATKEDDGVPPKTETTIEATAEPEPANEEEEAEEAEDGEITTIVEETSLEAQDPPAADAEEATKTVGD